MSRSNFVRKLPRTYQFLTEKLRASVLTGYGKVADNTYPNLVPILTGQNAYGESDLPTHDLATQFYDHWPFIWKDFRKHGYATMFAEDLPEFGTFNYLAKGFLQQPVDHYMRPFWLHLSKSPLSYLSSHLCYDTIPVYEFLNDYVYQTAEAYSRVSRPYFAWAWHAAVSHEYINQVEVADEHFLHTLQKLNDNKLLHNTALFVISDHGHRFDAIRSTLVGRIEERLPFFSVTLPPWILAKYPHISSTLTSNTDRLTSPYDVFEMLQDILHFPDSFSPGDVDVDGSRRRSRFGVSLFTHQVPLNRSCPGAGIPETYCMCQQSGAVNVSDPRVVQAAEAVISQLNHMLKGYGGLCLQLRLSSIMSAQVLLPDQNLVTSDGGATWRTNDFFIHFVIMLRAVPSDAIFDATVKYNVKSDEFSVITDISRINKYGDQSKCIGDKVLRKYCYCHDFQPGAVHTV